MEHMRNFITKQKIYMYLDLYDEINTLYLLIYSVIAVFTVIIVIQQLLIIRLIRKKHD